MHGDAGSRPVNQHTERIMTKQPKKTAAKTATRTPKAGKPAAGAETKTKPATVAAAEPKTKLGRLEAMLRRPEGATIAQLAKALDWQAHSVRGAMSGALKKKQSLAITVSKEEGADRVYRIAG
jgi:hypothetical protein